MEGQGRWQRAGRVSAERGRWTQSTDALEDLLRKLRKARILQNSWGWHSLAGEHGISTSSW